MPHLKAHVLCIDECAERCLLIWTLLTNHGFKVTTVHDPAEAVDIVHTEHVDVIVSVGPLRAYRGLTHIRQLQYDRPDAPFAPTDCLAKPTAIARLPKRIVEFLE